MLLFTPQNEAHTLIMTVLAAPSTFPPTELTSIVNTFVYHNSNLILCATCGKVQFISSKCMSRSTDLPSRGCSGEFLHRI